MNSRLISIIRKEFIQLFRDKRLLALILILPLVQLFLLGYAATNDVRNIPVAVFDQSHSPEGRALLDAYRAADYFMLAYSVNSDAELRQLIEKGQAGVGLIIPPDYAARLQEGQSAGGLHPGWLRPNHGDHRPFGCPAHRPESRHPAAGGEAGAQRGRTSSCSRRWRCAPRSGTTRIWSRPIS